MSKIKNLKIYGLVILVLLFGFRAAGATEYTLDQCKKLALENSLKIKNGELAVDASAETKKATFTSYFPKIFAGGNYFKNNKDLFQMNLPFMPGMEISMFDRATVFSLTAMQPIFTGGRIINGNKLASLGKQVDEKKLILTKNEILLKTEEQYWGIVSLDAKLDSLIAYSKLLDDLYKQLDDAVKYGILTRNDLMKVSVKRSELELNKQKLENGRHLARLAFCQLLGIPYEPDMILTGSLEQVENPQTYYLENEKVLKNRAEYSLLQYGVKAEKLQHSLKLGELLPEIGIGASGFYLNAMNNGGVYNFAVFGTVSLPISDWWKGSHVLKEKKIREKIAENTLKDSSELLMVQMQKAWYELTESYKEVSLAGELVKQSEENLKETQDAYKQGVITISDLLEAQALNQEAKVKDIEARAGNRVKLVNYLQVTGRYESN